MKKQFTGAAALLGTTIVWGSAFIAQSVGMDSIGPFTFQMFRCALAVLFLLPLSRVMDGKKGTAYWKRQWTDPVLWKSGLICGVTLFAASSLQQIGLVYTDAGKAGFLTAMYIVFVPFLGFFVGQKPGRNAVLSLVPAVIGLYLLSCTGTSGINKGDLMLLGCAVCFSIQILLIDRHSANLDGVRLNCVQSLVVTVLSIPFALLTEDISLPAIWTAAPSIAYAGILSMGVAYTLQIFGQKRVAPTAAALLMSMESVFAALFGWLLLHETMTSLEGFGCVLVFAAVILSQLPEKKTSKVR